MDLDEEHALSRSELKRQMFESFGDDRCTKRTVGSIEEVLELITKDEADVMLTISGPQGTAYYAVRFKDPDFSKRARADSLWLYGLEAQ